MFALTDSPIYPDAFADTDNLYGFSPLFITLNVSLSVSNFCSNILSASEVFPSDFIFNGSSPSLISPLSEIPLSSSTSFQCLIKVLYIRMIYLSIITLY